VKKCGIIKNASNFVLELEQPGILHEKYPMNNFLTVQPISTNNIPIDSGQRVEENDTLKILQISLQGQPWNFREGVPSITFLQLNRILLATNRLIQHGK
jgi:hypothetical protein